MLVDGDLQFREPCIVDGGLTYWLSDEFPCLGIGRNPVCEFISFSFRILLELSVKLSDVGDTAG